MSWFNKIFGNCDRYERVEYEEVSVEERYKRNYIDFLDDEIHKINNNEIISLQFQYDCLQRLNQDDLNVVIEKRKEVLEAKKRKEEIEEKIKEILNGDEPAYILK